MGAAASGASVACELATAAVAVKRAVSAAPALCPQSHAVRAAPHASQQPMPRQKLTDAGVEAAVASSQSYARRRRHLQPPA